MPTKRKMRKSKGKTKRRTTRKGKAKRQWEWPDMSWVFHPVLWAVLLFVFAFLTLGTLIAPAQGSLLVWWRDRVRYFVGYAIYAVPPLAALAAWWLVRYSSGEEEAGPVTYPLWARLVGAFLTLSGLAGVIHFLSFSPDPQRLAYEGRGGGILGWVVSDFLVRNVGPWLAMPFLGIILFVGLALTLDVTPAEVAMGFRWLLHRGRKEEELPEAPWETIPTIEEPEAYLPWWRRLWHRLRSAREREAVEPPPTRIVGDEPAAESPPPVSPYTPVEPYVPEAPAYSAPTTAPSPEPSSATALSPASPPPPPPLGEGGNGREWKLPDIREIFEDTDEGDISEEEIRQRSRIIEETLAAFGVPVRVVEVNRGPTVTQFGVQPGYIERVDRKTGTVRREKVKVSRILALQNDLALALAAAPIRIEAPVPGKPIVGIEVPNKRTAIVTLRSVMESEVWRTFKGRLKIALGRDVAGRPVVADLARMPHLLIAGATGSGKSVCINAIIASLMSTHTPDEVRFILVDPKRVELTAYEGVPHLIGNVITDVEMVVSVLQWAVREMERRYELFARERVRDIVRYNKKAETQEGLEPLPYIVIIVDELADLMLSSPDEVEHAVVRLAQMARATGIHLVLATQRPSVDVVTGLIKANFPARISFAVTSQVDSRVILDTPGAEQLLGQGDMLFLPPDSSKLARLQGVYVSDREIQRLVDFWRRQQQERMPQPEVEAEEEDAEVISVSSREEPEEGEWEQPSLWEDLLGDLHKNRGRDPLFDEAVRVVREANRASISLLQRRLRIGYARAGRLIDELEEAGIIGPDPGGGRSRVVYPPQEPGSPQEGTSAPEE